MEISEKESVLSDYTGFLARQWPLLLLGLLIGLALGIATLAVSPKTYEATTSVLVQPTGDDTNVQNGRTDAAINLDTEAQIVTSTVVAERSAELMNSDLKPRELAKRVSVQVPANTSVLKITFAAASPSKAQNGAKSFAEAYLANRKKVAEDKLQSTVTGLEKTIASLNQSLIRVNQDLVAPASDSRRGYLAAQRKVLVQQIRATTASLSPLQNQEVQPGAVITQAQRPTTPSGLNPWLVMISALFAGLLLGLAMGVIRDRRDHRIRSRHDLERLGLDVLVGRFALPRPEDVLAHRPRHDDPLRQCRNALLARLEAHRGSLVVSAASSSILGATAAASVAVTFARSGVRTVLVGCNTGADITAEAFGVAESPSLTDVLRAEVRPDEAMHRVPATANLAVVPPGPEGSLYSELLQEASVRPTLEEFESLAEVVVVDAATTAFNADAQSVVTATQGLLLVVTADVTSSDEVLEAIYQMEHVDAVLLGALLVDAGGKPSRSVRKTQKTQKKAQKKAARQPRADHDDTADDAILHRSRRIGASAAG
jgi:capsular polysaccharide biosynthesis protein/Mrp family chromosome partitioning ATPase